MTAEVQGWLDDIGLQPLPQPATLASLSDTIYTTLGEGRTSSTTPADDHPGVIMTRGVQYPEEMLQGRGPWGDDWLDFHTDGTQQGRQDFRALYRRYKHLGKGGELGWFRPKSDFRPDTGVIGRTRTSAGAGYQWKTLDSRVQERKKKKK